MQAVVYHEYGSPDVLELREVPRPVAGDDEVLVRVRASSVNSWDWDLLRGTPFLTRIGALRTPRYAILGADIAGRVEAVGSRVTRFHPGDEVYGDVSRCGWGGFSEYVCADQDVLAPIPAGLTFEQAAAVPQAAVIAVQGLRYRGEIQPGQRVLINGAGGGAGTFAVQIAAALGAEVTGVDSPGKLDMVRSLGAAHVIDYTQQNFTRTGQRYDRILDLAVYRSIFHLKRALRPEGVCAVAGGSTARIFQAMLLAPWTALTGSKKVGVAMHRPNGADLASLNGWLEAGRVVPVIDREYPLPEVAGALRYFAEGNVTGKVVISVGGAP
jgi:NADPH:quinone reductase-like Zn-dependent oxidoreductase